MHHKCIFFFFTPVPDDADWRVGPFGPVSYQLATTTTTTTTTTTKDLQKKRALDSEK